MLQIVMILGVWEKRLEFLVCLLCGGIVSFGLIQKIYCSIREEGLGQGRKKGRLGVRFMYIRRGRDFLIIDNFFLIFIGID